MHLSKNPVILFIIAWGFLTVLSWTDNYIPDPRLNMMLYYAAFILFIYSSYLLNNDFTFESNYFKRIFFIFIIYEIFVFCHGMYSNHVKFFSFDELFWFLRGGYYQIWPLAIPFFVFFDKRISNFALLFDWIIKLGIFALILLPFFPSIFFTRALSVNLPGLTYGCGIVLIYATYIKDKKINISFIVILITLLAFTYLARRNNIVTIFGFILGAYLLNFRSNHRPILFKSFPVLIVIGLIIAINYTDLTKTLTSRLSERLTEDSRSDIILPFLLEMDDYMVFGKGMSGTYYCPSGGEIEEEGVVFAEVDDRDLIEVGYLQLYLNGGIIYVLLFLFIMVPAAINGIFKSNNLFTKACGVIIFLWLVDMFIYGLPALSLHYIFVWICVGICFKPSFRYKTDVEIRSEFLNYEMI